MTVPDFEQPFLRQYDKAPTRRELQCEAYEKMRADFKWLRNVRCEYHRTLRDEIIGRYFHRLIEIDAERPAGGGIKHRQVER